MSAQQQGVKNNEIGKIPEDWESSPIGEVGRVSGGRQRSPGRVGDLTPYLRVANVFDGYIDLSDVLEMPFTKQERSRFLLKEGDILLNEGQSLDLVGRSAIYRGQPSDCCFQNTLVRFRPSRRMNSGFCQAVFQRYLHTGVFAAIALQTTSIAHLGAQRFAKLRIPVPLLAEQRAIAQALEDADGLIEALAALIAKKHAIKHGATQDLLTGQRRLLGFKGEWVTERIGEIFEFGRSVPLSRAQLTDDDGYHYIHYGDIHSRLHSHVDLGVTPTPFARRALCGSATALKVGDWILADASEDCEGVAKAIEITGLPCDRDAVAGLHTFLLREKRPTFASGFKGHIASSPHFRSQVLRLATGMKVYGVSKYQMKTIELYFPPDLEEQRAIATVLSNMDAEIAALDAKLAKARAMRQGMMQVLLSGEVRLT